MFDTQTASGVDEVTSANPATGELNQTDTTNTPAEPDAYDLTDPNRLIKVAGSDKPVKFADHVRGFQSQFTKAAQRAAALERQLQERDQKLAQLERAQQEAARRSQTGQNQPNPYDSIRQLPYITGEQMAGVAENFVNQIGQTHQIILGLATEVQKMQKVLGTLNTETTNRQFESKISKFLSDGGFDPDYSEMAKELYLAYEPSPELDIEFPEILRARIELAERMALKRQQAAVQTQRQRAFIPGKGGNGRPGKPLQLDPAADARDTANQLRETLQGTAT